MVTLWFKISDFSMVMVEFITDLKDLYIQLDDHLFAFPE